MSSPRILITSAAGKSGMAAALDLLERGFPVRAIVRSDDARAQRLRDAGAEVVIGNMGDTGDMRRAMQDVQRAYFCAPMAANGLHYGMVFAVAAQEAGIEHVVLMSQWLADPNNPSVHTRESWLTERILGMLPNVATTVVNPGWFADNYFTAALEPIAQLGLPAMPLGDGRNAPVSNEDIGRAVAAILADPASHAGRTYRPTGPTLMSPQDIAATLGDALGRRVRYMNISERLFRKAMQASGFPDFVQTELGHYTREYRDGGFAAGGPTDTVRALTGREPEDFATIARRYFEERPEAKRGLGNKLRAIGNFVRLLLTRPLDLPRLEHKRDHVQLQEPRYVTQSGEWKRSHEAPGAFGVGVRAMHLEVRRA